jgi:hypothetical protein
MRLRILGFDVEIRGLEDIVGKARRVIRDRPVELHINRPTIHIPAREVLRQLTPWLIIIIAIIFVVILIPKQG